jgi:BirA family biotin operon repressor/biotin-[acetyl-CoA-carboxylase] ligase
MSCLSSKDGPVIDAPLLAHLVDAKRPWAWSELAERLNRSQAALQTALDGLRRAGCRIEFIDHGHVWLHEAGLGSWLDYLQYYFGARRSMHVYRATNSTQDVARGFLNARHGAPEGAFVVADSQTAGRGRLGRRWHARAGLTLPLTMVHHPRDADPSQAINRLALSTSVAVAEALNRWLAECNQQAQIKWPNDIYAAGGKLGGILLEMVSSPAGRAALIGVGVNVNQTGDDLTALNQDCSRPATSLRACLGRPVSRLAVLGAIVSKLDDYLHERSVDEMIRTWRDRCMLLGQDVTLQSNGQPFSGQVVDLHPYEGLIVRGPHGVLTHLPAASTTVR